MSVTPVPDAGVAVLTGQSLVVARALVRFAVESLRRDGQALPAGASDLLAGLSVAADASFAALVPTSEAEVFRAEQSPPEHAPDVVPSDGDKGSGPLSVLELAQRAGLSDSLVRRECRQGRVPGACRTFDGWVVPDSPALHEWIERKQR